MSPERLHVQQDVLHEMPLANMLESKIMRWALKARMLLRQG